jgi:hypothetical protein
MALLLNILIKGNKIKESYVKFTKSILIIKN